MESLGIDRPGTPERALCGNVDSVTEPSEHRGDVVDSTLYPTGTADKRW
jgi:hypothetical protein